MTSVCDFCMQMTCEICFEAHPFEKMKAPRCGHYFCETCWTGQVLAHHFVGESTPSHDHLLGCILLRTGNCLALTDFSVMWTIALAIRLSGSKYYVLLNNRL